ncbi:VWA domain-containing protein [Legionella cardiaca]|uniref:VWA domain-containing protein n=1 Tax=Legionella cardiaca TaxID=1071983 RepID=A0ABY8AX04_9GAMM|nr:VWA domain-containing protein [Legionella cardiaca]WED44711.1 VWA domain-containing protein [Legionella cardiaca]
MMTEFHFLRPWWLLTLLPLLYLGWYLWRQKPQMEAWAAICDRHLLERLVVSKGKTNRHWAFWLLLASALCMIISLSGPTWSRLPVPVYKQIQPRVLVLDMSDAMLAHDLSPNRLSRAKFKLHDLFKRRDIGQVGLIVYSGEPFVVSPLTDDGQTIDALLASLSPDIMPVEGHQLNTALEEAGQLIKQAGFHRGQILVLTAETPSTAAIAVAKELANERIITSILPIKADKNLNPLFQEFAAAGQGALLPFTDDSGDLDKWLAINSGNQFHLDQQDDIPLWRDEGRWFLLPALLFLLPVFRRGWLQRVDI